MTPDGSSPERDQPGSRLGLRRGLLAAGVVIAVVAGVVAILSGTLTPGDRAPLAGARQIELRTRDGGTTTLEAFEGTPLVVNFFASWCPPCRAEMPDLERAHQRLDERVRFLGVNVDFDETTWKSFVAESGVTYETVFEPTQELLRAVGGEGMPTTILLDQDGNVRYLHTGALDDDTLVNLVAEELGV